jgi:hypothetical protein
MRTHSCRLCSEMSLSRDRRTLRQNPATRVIGAHDDEDDAHQ